SSRRRAARHRSSSPTASSPTPGTSSAGARCGAPPSKHSRARSPEAPCGSAACSRRSRSHTTPRAPTGARGGSIPLSPGVWSKSRADDRRKRGDRRRGKTPLLGDRPDQLEHLERFLIQFLRLGGQRAHVFEREGILVRVASANRTNSSRSSGRGAKVNAW